MHSRASRKLLGSSAGPCRRKRRKRRRAKVPDASQVLVRPSCGHAVITSAEADLAGPWSVEPLPGLGFGLFRLGERPPAGLCSLCDLPGPVPRPARRRGPARHRARAAAAPRPGRRPGRLRRPARRRHGRRPPRAVRRGPARRNERRRRPGPLAARAGARAGSGWRRGSGAVRRHSRRAHRRPGGGRRRIAIRTRKARAPPAAPWPAAPASATMERQHVSAWARGASLGSFIAPAWTFPVAA